MVNWNNFTWLVCIILLITYYANAEALFGYAPFSSETIEELHMKFLEDTPIKVHTYLIRLLVYVCHA